MYTLILPKRPGAQDIVHAAIILLLLELARSE
jgi:hypothetical protein